METPSAVKHAMKKLLFRLWQWTWGFPQSLLGLIFRIVYRHCPKEEYRGTIVTHWPIASSMGVGMYLFLGTSGNPDHRAQVLVHEFGHSVQSLILGPLFLPIMGIPSFLWANLPPCRKLRREKKVSYYAFYPESNANRLGHLVTGEKCDLNKESSRSTNPLLLLSLSESQEPGWVPATVLS